MGRRGRPPHPDILTPREWEVLDLLRERLTNEQIAERLGITLDGAKYHVSEILSKLGLTSRQEAASWQPASPQPAWWQRLIALPVAAKIAGIATLIAVGTGVAVFGLASLRLGDSAEDVQESVTALREPTAEDLQRMVIQNEDLPDGFASVQFCEHQNPVPSADGSFAVTFFERSESDSDRSECVVSYVGLQPSAADASASMQNMDEFFDEYLNRPIEGVDSECATFHEVDGPVIGEESRIFVSDCLGCSGDEAVFFWIQFRAGRLLASPRLLFNECQTLDEAVALTRKQEQRIQTTLNAID